MSTWKWECFSILQQREHFFRQMVRGVFKESGNTLRTAVNAVKQHFGFFKDWQVNALLCDLNVMGMHKGISSKRDQFFGPYIWISIVREIVFVMQMMKRMSDTEMQHLTHERNVHVKQIYLRKSWRNLTAPAAIHYKTAIICGVEMIGKSHSES